MGIAWIGLTRVVIELLESARQSSKFLYKGYGYLGISGRLGAHYRTERARIFGARGSRAESGI